MSFYYILYPNSKKSSTVDEKKKDMLRSKTIAQVLRLIQTTENTTTR